MQKIYLLLLPVLLIQCDSNPSSTLDHEAFINDVRTNNSSFYYLEYDLEENSQSLPIGIFDSGIGGLTVFDAIINSDNFNSLNNRESDGVKDFSKESFIYLADQANMPYSNYVEIGKTKLLREHILKDAIFLLNKKYHKSPLSNEISYDKPSVKTIVIACNTATAFGQTLIRDYFKEEGIDVKVLGVVDAGARGALEAFDEDENGIIAVFATPATVKSEAYLKSLEQQIVEKGLTGDIEFFQQGGKGLHESIDNKEDFIRNNAASTSIDYKGPSPYDKQYVIDRNLLQSYNFDTTKFQLLANKSSVFSSDTLQINSVKNYVRYHIVSLVERIRQSGDGLQLKSIILGCTHYPYVKNEISEVLSELREREAYMNILSGEISLIDPADNLAIELYEYLSESNLLYSKTVEEERESAFYISVPNIFNSEVEVTSESVFNYEYQYLKREANTLSDYTLIIPFSSEVISAPQLEQIEKKLPATYKLINIANPASDK